MTAGAPRLATPSGHRRFVAIGDSTAEGVGDEPWPDGTPRGFNDRLAGLLAERGEVLYANLAVRGRLVAQIREEQLGPALALGPDLVSVLGGLNDALRPGFERAHVEAELGAIVSACRAAGAEVLTMTIPDLSAVMPIARLVRDRLLALNDAVRTVSERHGARVNDLAHSPLGGDPRVWAPDRLHASPEGHARIAASAAHALGLQDDDGTTGLPPATARAPHAVVAGELAWAGRHLAPWVLRRVRGRSSGDGIVAKRPALTRYDAVSPGGSTSST